VSPGQFSPNGDGRYDTTKITWSLPDSEAVSLVVRNAAGTVVRGPLNFGTQAAGAHSYLWNGVINSGAHASSGTYGLELTTNRPIPGGRLYGSAVGSIRVDTVAPTLASITGSGTTFYPYPDGYRDTVSPAFTLNEPATVTLTVKNSAGSVVRTVLAYKAAGRSSLTWNGRNSSGALAAGGTYYWTLTAQDPAGNRRTSARYSVIVNAKRLITKTATLVENGNAFTSAGGSASCAEADTTMSDFAYGVWLTNYCDPYLDGTQIAAAIYRFTVPAAVSYTSLRVDALGFSLAPSSLTAGYTQWATGHTTFTPIITAGTASAWRTVGSVAAAGFVNSSRIVEASLVVPNVHYPDDYDIGQVRLAVTYKVLA
jgi:flagellar hook assembly protein FlgD